MQPIEASENPSSDQLSDDQDQTENSAPADESENQETLTESDAGEQAPAVVDDSQNATGGSEQNETESISDPPQGQEQVGGDESETEETAGVAGVSIARYWNEVLLHLIRNDFARPTVHARNLFHAAIAFYDAWAVYDDTAQTYLLGKELGGFNCPVEAFIKPADIERARREAISYAAYRLLHHRFDSTPSGLRMLHYINDKMRQLAYPIGETSTEYVMGSAAAMGNYLAQCIIDFGLQDGSNEQFKYRNQAYQPVNPPLVLQAPGNPTIVDYNRWQPLKFQKFIDQSGNQVASSPDFLGPEWGLVQPFALEDDKLNIYQRDGFDYWVYEDPGAPPKLALISESNLASSEAYQWGFTLVSIWSSHLDPGDGVMWDISPASIGNLQSLPQAVSGYPGFYRRDEGGDISTGHSMNPHTGEPYAPNIVPRGDYARVLAEFWADGPDSETPPGHWFVILNYVNDQPQLVKRFRGQGDILDDLEWDVKAYFSLGGAVHDAAIAAWGIKGWYDYIRPISAIRAMADMGQSSDPLKESYSPGGIPLVNDYIEVVQEGDPLAGSANQHVGKIKLYAWVGSNDLARPSIETAGVDWILAENWWPYQRPTFVTPPFAGYISGHSTYSRVAAEVLTLLTGDAFFPGGLGIFQAPKNEFLVFEDGPSVDVNLQWATYRDASDQCSLSRIWGGIHPPADDIPGRRIGEVIGISAFNKAENYFQGQSNQ